MAQTTVRQEDVGALTTAKLLLGLAVASVLVAVAAGVILLAAAPADGSTAESTLGIIAAVAGLATAGFAVAAMVYAQVKNLWQYVPTWLRVVAWVVVVYAVATTVWGWMT